jgi:signal transduction histidine kinase
VLPLITHNKVIGVLSAQSQRAGAFSTQDVTGFQIMCDQLANAIENARLYADAQRRAEDLAQAYEQLKELEVLKDQFMQNVSHELRTPLTMIRGYAEFILAGQMGAVDPEQREALQVILRNSEALSELVADILAMLEISATKTTLTAISMVETVLDSVVSHQILAAENGVALSADLPASDGSCQVMAREDHLRRITDNLLGNALKFTPAGGQVNVRLREGEHRVFLEVADTGVGIPSHLQERIFERFFQVDSSQRRARGGAGLGLALVKELVESYGGSVSAFSPGTGQGSTLTVVLPRLEA